MRFLEITSSVCSSIKRPGNPVKGPVHRFLKKSGLKNPDFPISHTYPAYVKFGKFVKISGMGDHFARLRLNRAQDKYSWDMTWMEMP